MPDPLNRTTSRADYSASSPPTAYRQVVYATTCRIRRLIAYGATSTEQFLKRQRTSDRISRLPSLPTLPVASPTKFDPVINLKTAKAYELDVSPILIALRCCRNDEAAMYWADV